MRMFLCALLLVPAAATVSRPASACEPGGFAGKYGGFGDKGVGVFVPGPIAATPAAPSPALYAAVAQQHQALAAQAAAYRAARRPLRLAKAYAMRQATLAARESRRAWVLAKQAERQRGSQQQELQPPGIAAAEPVYVAWQTKAAGPSSP